MIEIKWVKEKSTGSYYFKASRNGSACPLRVYADRAIMSDDSERFEWYADEQVRPFGRWSQGIVTYETLAEAQKKAEEWIRNPEAFTSVRYAA